MLTLSCPEFDEIIKVTFVSIHKIFDLIQFIAKHPKCAWEGFTICRRRRERNMKLPPRDAELIFDLNLVDKFKKDEFTCTSKAH